jgi:tripartite-type tricarboxylate transporter receptor subunit TctC
MHVHLAPRRRPAHRGENHATFWQGLFAPAGTPAPIIARLADALRAGTSDPALAARYAEQGTPLLVGGPEELARLLAEDTEVWQRVARETNLRID